MLVMSTHAGYYCWILPVLPNPAEIDAYYEATATAQLVKAYVARSYSNHFGGAQGCSTLCLRHPWGSQNQDYSRHRPVKPLRVTSTRCIRPALFTSKTLLRDFASS